MNELRTDPIEAFYDRHPYPPPVVDLNALELCGPDTLLERLTHHLVWPDRPVGSVTSLLIAGCGTSQAARQALRHPGCRVVGIDVSEASIEHTRRLAELHDLGNLEVHQLPIERIGELGARFDHVICTGVLHHLADPTTGLRCLRDVLAPGGAVTLMVYAAYGRTGVYLMQDYCRRLGISTAQDEITDLVATLREIPAGHPVSPLLRESRDFLDDGALADALLNPRDRAYSVPDLFELLAAAGLRFGRWARQAPYLPDCGAISETPHAARIAALPVAEQHAVLELFRGTIARHTAIAFAADDPASGRLDFDERDVDRWVPIRVATAIAIEERLPPGAAAALLNRAHTDTDLVTFVDRDELDVFRRIDGKRPVGALGPGAPRFVERLWRHDLVVIDATQTDAREVRP